MQMAEKKNTELYQYNFNSTDLNPTAPRMVHRVLHFLSAIGLKKLNLNRLEVYGGELGELGRGGGGGGRGQEKGIP